MIRKGTIFLCFCMHAVLWSSQVSAQRPQTLIEPPALKSKVQNDILPRLSQRIPQDPWIVDLQTQKKQPGRYGGELRLLLGKQKDTRLLTVYSYARLVCYTTDFRLQPDLLKSFDVKEDRIFTLHLRRGHRWSDGHPFSAEDFRYYWEDVLNNPDLPPLSFPKELLVENETPVFQVIDEFTVRYSWSKPNPIFLQWLAGARPPSIYRPAHYLKQFHIRYGDQKKIKDLVKKERKRNWAELHFSRDRSYLGDNPDLPTLQPWKNTTHPPADRFVFTRNPYYHRLDKNGRQLPYIDRVIITLGATDTIPLRVGSGEADLQARYLRFDHYTFLKQAAKRNAFRVFLWQRPKSSHKALYPNLNANDPVWRDLFRDVRFRKALSLAIDRHEINQVIYFGLAQESNNTVLPESPLFRPDYKTLWGTFDLKKANALLDDVGLTKRDDEGVRLLSDGRPMHLIVETAGESTEDTDILELIHDSWQKIGIALFVRPSQRDVFRKRILSGQAQFAIWSGLANGLVDASMPPQDFTPSSSLQYQWPQWGKYFETNGKQGKRPELPEVLRLADLNKAWRQATSIKDRTRIWHDILKLNAEQVFTIGIINATLQPVIVHKRLRNVPEKGIYHWNPGAYFGLYKPDTFWFDNEQAEHNSEPKGKS